MDFNIFLAELFDQTAILGLASAFNVATQKFLNMSLGAPNPGVLSVCRGRKSKFCGHKWRYKSEEFVYFRAVFATNVRTGVEVSFPSVGKASGELFGNEFQQEIFISASCRSGREYRGFRFRYEDNNDGYVHVKYPGNVEKNSSAQA